MQNRHLHIGSSRSPSPVRWFGLWRGGNIAALPVWCGLIVLVLLTAAGGDRAKAQTLEEATAIQAFAVVENWVARAAVPDSVPTLETAGVAAVHVTLRFEGVTMGQATATRDDPLEAVASDEPRNVLALLRPATREALEAVKRSLTTLNARPGQGAAPDQIEQIAPLLQLDIQLAGPPRPLRLERLAHLPERMVVDVHGLALRKGSDWAWQFPGNAIAANLSLVDQVERLRGQLRLGPMALRDLAAEEAPRFYRFAVAYVVGPSADRPPRRLYRGQEVLPTRPLTLDETRRLTDRWATYLEQRQRPEGYFAGTYHPTGDRYDPARASAADAALAAYALARYARLDRLDADRRQALAAASRRAIERIVQQMGIDPSAERADASQTARLPTADLAMTLIALLETPGAGDLKSIRDRLAGLVRSARTADGRFRRATHARATEATRPASALATLALVRYFDQTRSPAYLEAARESLGALWADAAEAPASVFPWAALAEFDLMRLERATPGVLTVRETCRALWRRQVRPEDAGSPQAIEPGRGASPDTVGGLVLDAELVPEPTWLTAGPLVALAAAMPGAHFVAEDERPQWMLDTALGLRFLEQLTLTKDAAYYVLRLSWAIGGVRTAFWDNRQPLSATAMALLAGSEFEHALDALLDQAEAP